MIEILELFRCSVVITWFYVNAMTRNDLETNLYNYIALFIDFLISSSISTV